jgi:ribosomal protein L7Ae-like RNA K-turn-binding protein
MKHKLLTLLGFAQKSGSLVSGTDQVLKSIESKKTLVCFLGNDVAENTSKKVISKCKHYNIPCITTFSVDELSRAIGKDNRTVLGLTNQGFTDSVLALTKDMGI